jgi:predicted deacylase
MKTFIETIKGKDKKGKKILIIAGVHGEEITPIYTLSLFYQIYLAKPGKFSKHFKSITIVNGINIAGLKEGTRDLHQKNTSDLNRMFETAKGEDSFKVLKGKIDKSDVIIDIHSSPSCAEFALIDIDEYSNSMEKWCDKSKVKTGFRYSGSDTIKRYCLESGKPALTIELNKLDKIDYDSAREGVEILKELVVNSKKYAYIDRSKPKQKEMIDVKTYCCGILSARFKSGETFNKGDIMYSIHDLELNESFSYEANFDGCVICEPSRHFVKRGDLIYLAQPLKTKT